MIDRVLLIVADRALAYSGGKIVEEAFSPKTKEVIE